MTDLELSTDGSVLVAASEKNVEVYSKEDGKFGLSQTLEFGESQKSIQLTEDGEHLVVSSQEQKTVTVLEKIGSEFKKLTELRFYWETYSAAFDAAKRLLVVGTYGGSFVYDGVLEGARKQIQTLNRSKVVAFSQLGKVIMGWQGTVEVYQTCADGQYFDSSSAECRQC